MSATFKRLVLAASRYRWRLTGQFFSSVQDPSNLGHVAVTPDNPDVLALLNNLAGLDLNKVMARRKESLIVPRYQLMTLEQLQEVRD